jgi:hypothetical protein
VWGYVVTAGTHTEPTVDGALTAHLDLVPPTFLAERWYGRVDSLGGWSFLAGGHRVRALSDTTEANGSRATARDLMWSPHDADVLRPDGALIADGLQGCPGGAYDSATQANARTYRDWRRLVNTGEVLPVLAGSGAAADTRDGQPPMGAWRTCVSSRPEYATELLPGKIAARAAYITSGPTFTRATLKGRGLGRNVGIVPGETVTLAVGIHSALPVDTLRIWLNGDVHSTTTFSPAAHDTAWSTSVTLYGLTEDVLWFDLVSASTPSWSDPGCGGLRYAISAPWLIHPLNASELYNYDGGVWSNAAADSIATYYNALTWASAADSTEFNDSAARIATETARVRAYWAGPSGRTLENGASEFPYTDLEAAGEGLSEGDTLYLHPGRYARPVGTIDIGNSIVTVRGWPGISRPGQCAIVQGSEPLPLFRVVNSDVTFADFCVRGGDALADTCALWEVGDADLTTWRGIRVANMTFDWDEGIFDLDHPTNWTIADCEFDSIEGEAYGVAYILGSSGGLWSGNRHTRSTYHGNYPIGLFAAGLTTFRNSLWAEIDSRNNTAPGLFVSQPADRVTIDGCTFVDCQTHAAAAYEYGVVTYDSGDNLLDMTRAVFVDCDTTEAVGYFDEGTIDTLSYSLAYQVTNWPPAAADTTGLVGTDPRFNAFDLDDYDVYRVTNRVALNYAAVDQLGWVRSKEPNPMPCALASRYGVRVIGGGLRHPVNTGRPFSEVEQ